MYVAILDDKGAQGKNLQATWEELKNNNAKNWEFENVLFYKVSEPLQVEQTIVEVPTIKAAEVKSTTRK